MTKHSVKNPDLDSDLKTLTDPKTPFSSRSKELIDSLTRLLQLRKNKRAHLDKTRKESCAGNVTVITGVMSVINLNLLMKEKKQLKGKCFKYLKEGHYTRDCKSAKRCVYCGEFRVHHRSLCPSKFEKTIVKESVHVSEEFEEATQSVPVQQGNTCLSIGETVLMQTALTEVSNTSSTRTD